jgi:hypothetical protein
MTDGNTEKPKWGIDLAGLSRPALELLATARERDLKRLDFKPKDEWSNAEHFTHSVVRMAQLEIRDLLDADASGAKLPEVSAVDPATAHVTMELAIAAHVVELLKGRGLPR